jgi:hypothetical protein
MDFRDASCLCLGVITALALEHVEATKAGEETLMNIIANFTR